VSPEFPTVKTAEFLDENPLTLIDFCYGFSSNKNPMDLRDYTKYEVSSDYRKLVTSMDDLYFKKWRTERNKYRIDSDLEDGNLFYFSHLLFAFSIFRGS
jgi:hypothetical protein